jgi:type III secretion protein T
MFELLGGNRLSELFWPLVVACPRIFGFWLAFPLFGQRVIPGMIRNGVTVSLALFVWPITASAMPDPRPPLSHWLFLGPKEVLIGFCIGFALGIVVWALESAGTLIDDASGTNNAAQMDPSAGAPLGPTGTLLRQYALALVLVSGLWIQFVLALVESFLVWKWYAVLPDIRGAGEYFFLQRSETYWIQTLRFATPVVFALLFIELGFGLVNRATPQFDVYRLAMPVKSIVAAVVIAISATFWADAVVSLMREDTVTLRNILRGN